MRCGRSGEADPGSDERVGEPDLPVRRVLVPEHEHRAEREHEKNVAAEQREPGATGLDELGRRGATITITSAAGRIAAPASSVE